MKIQSILFVLCLCLNFMGFSQKTQAQTFSSCPKTPVKTSIKIIETPLQYNFGTSHRDLTRKKGEGSAITTGLSEAKNEIAVSYSMQLSGTRYALCPALDIKINLILKDRLVSVAREIPQNSCSFKEVYNHEIIHTQIDSYILQKWSRIVEGYAQKVFSQQTPVFQTEYQAKAYYEKYANQFIHSVSQEIDKDRKIQQGNHDSPQEYARIERSCNGEIRRYIR